MRILVRARGGVSWMWLVGAAALAFSSACDDGGSGETCGKVEPCGGEVLGEWQVGAACVGSASAVGELLTGAVSRYCPTATVGPLDLKPSGSLSFRADLTFSASVSVDVSAKLGFPSSCVDSVPCDLVSLGLQAWLKQNSIPLGIDSLTCTGTLACTCRLVVHAPAIDETGTYVEAGTSLTLRGSSGTVTADYCMQEPELHLIMARPGGTGPVSQSSFAADLVATKVW